MLCDYVNRIVISGFYILIVAFFIFCYLLELIYDLWIISEVVDFGIDTKYKVSTIFIEELKCRYYAKDLGPVRVHHGYVAVVGVRIFDYPVFFRIYYYPDTTGSFCLLLLPSLTTINSCYDWIKSTSGTIE